MLEKGGVHWFGIAEEGRKKLRLEIGEIDFLKGDSRGKLATWTLLFFFAVRVDLIAGNNNSSRTMFNPKAHIF